MLLKLLEYFPVGELFDMIDSEASGIAGPGQEAQGKRRAVGHEESSSSDGGGGIVIFTASFELVGNKSGRAASWEGKESGAVLVQLTLPPPRGRMAWASFILRGWS